MSEQEKPSLDPQEDKNKDSSEISSPKDLENSQQRELQKELKEDAQEFLTKNDSVSETSFQENFNASWEALAFRFSVDEDDLELKEKIYQNLLLQFRDQLLPAGSETRENFEEKDYQLIKAEILKKLVEKVEEVKQRSRGKKQKISYKAFAKQAVSIIYSFQKDGQIAKITKLKQITDLQLRLFSEAEIQRYVYAKEEEDTELNQEEEQNKNDEKYHQFYTEIANLVREKITAEGDKKVSETVFNLLLQMAIQQYEISHFKDGNIDPEIRSFIKGGGYKLQLLEELRNEQLVQGEEVEIQEEETFQKYIKDTEKKIESLIISLKSELEIAGYKKGALSSDDKAEIRTICRDMLSAVFSELNFKIENEQSLKNSFELEILKGRMLEERDKIFNDFAVNSAQNEDKETDQSKKEDPEDEKITDGSRNHEEFSQIEAFRSISLLNLFKEWQSESIAKGDQIRFILQKVINEKVQAMKEDFISLALENGEGQEIGLERLKNFSELASVVFDLIDYQVLSGYSLNTNQLTVKHDRLVESLTKDGAMKRNATFNENPLVNTINLDRQQFSKTAGIIQRMVFVAYQEMKKQPSKATKGDSTSSLFSRNQGFSSNLAEEMFTKHILNFDKEHRLSETDISDLVETPVGIKDELRKFPKEAQDLLILFARLKTTRDDLGGKAGLWHLGRNKGALKFSDGDKGRPSGVLSSIFYNVGKNLTREMHAASLAWIDPRETELMTTGRKGAALQKNLSRAHTLYDKWDGKAGTDAKMNQEVLRMSEEIHNFLQWKNPNWEKINFEKYTPKSWDEDFPTIDVMTNQAIDAILADDYKKSKEAFLNIIETANQVFASMRLSPDATQMREKIKVFIKNISSEVAKTFSFIGLYSNKDNKFLYTHQMIEAAYKFYIFGILTSVPGDVSLFGRVRAGYFGPDHAYNQLYKVAEETIIQQIEQNSSLKDYEKNLINFIRESPIKREYVLPDAARISFNNWRVKNVSELRNMDWRARDIELSKNPECPVNVREGWKPSYLDPTPQKT